MEEEWVEGAAESLERITRDPMADAYRGTVRVVSASEPARRGMYQACTMQLALEAPGLAPETLDTEFVFPRRRWPAVGAVVPARISRSEPRQIDARWDLLPR